jgi:hypothetical protein
VAALCRGTILCRGRLGFDANIAMHDPEFNKTTNQFVWSDPNGQVWIGEVDPATGYMQPSSGKGLQVG